MKIRYLLRFLIIIILFGIYQLIFIGHRCYIFASEQGQAMKGESNIIKIRINNNFEKINSFIADLDIKRDDGENIKGKVYYKNKPDIKMKVLWEYPDGNKAVMYDSKDSRIVYLPAKNIAFRKKTSKGELIDIGIALLNNINQKLGEAYEDKDFYYYEVGLPTPPLHAMTDDIPVKIKGFINKKQYYTEKVIFLNRGNKELETQEFKNYQLNIPIDDKEFEFVAPKNCQVNFYEEE